MAASCRHIGAFVLFLVAVPCAARCTVNIAAPEASAVVVLPDSTPDPVQLAATDFLADALAATGCHLTTASAVPAHAPAVILPAVAGASPLLDDLERRGVLDLNALRGKWEAYSLVPVTKPFPGVDSALVVAGSDERGAVFGLYEASERLFGTDPLKLWTDHRPAHIQSAQWDAPAVHGGPPAFRYRAFFINDEDQLAGWKGETPRQALDNATWDRLFETVMRSRGNAMAPPVHCAPMTHTQQLRARERGILVAGTTGFEALRGAPDLVWPVYSQSKFGKPLPYSFSLHPQEVEAFWTDIVRANRDHIRIWPVGMRGTSDWPFWVDDPAAPTTMDGRAELVSRVIRLQRSILDREIGPDPARAFIFTMRNEGLDLYRTGKLELPENTILVWDDWPKIGRVRDLPTPREAANPGGNGIYYHITASQGQWVQYVSPALVAGELARAYRAGASRYVLFNVGDLREFLMPTAAAMDAAWRTPEWIANPDAPAEFTRRWCARQFGEPAAPEAARLYDRLMELENRCRSTSVVEAVAPWVTTRELYDIWDPMSVHRLVQETSAPELLGAYGHLLNLQRLPQRMWPVSRAFLDELKPEWEELHNRAENLRDKVSEAGRRFYSDNLLVQIDTARGINAWALGVFTAFDLAQLGNHAAAAAAFDRAAAEMDAIAAARSEACHGEWKNWYRGETDRLFVKSLWTLKPHLHAEDTRACAALARQCVDAAAGSGKAEPSAVQVFPLLPDALDVSRELSPLFAPIARVPQSFHPSESTRAWVCGVVLDCSPEAAPVIRVGTTTATLPSTGEGRRRIFSVPVPPGELTPGEVRVEFTVNGATENSALGYGVANLLLVVMDRASGSALDPASDRSPSGVLIERSEGGSAPSGRRSAERRHQ